MSRYSKQIEADNLRFRKMSKARKRVAIARDVLAQLKVGKFKATPGTYVESKALETDDSNVQIQSLLLPPTVSCDVCGIGALFVCGV